jgi:hypothetical protein
MPIVVVPANVEPQQVDGFPSDCARSVQGALHIRPASTLEITDGELEHLNKVAPYLVKKLIVVPQKAKAPASPKAEPSAAPAEAAPEAEAPKEPAKRGRDR